MQIFRSLFAFLLFISTHSLNNVLNVKGIFIFVVSVLYAINIYVANIHLNRIYLKSVASLFEWETVEFMKKDKENV